MSTRDKKIEGYCLKAVKSLNASTGSTLPEILSYVKEKCLKKSDGIQLIQERSALKILNGAVAKKLLARSGTGRYKSQDQTPRRVSRVLAKKKKDEKAKQAKEAAMRRSDTKWKGKALQKVDKHIRKSIGKEKTGGKKTPKGKTPKGKKDDKARKTKEAAMRRSDTKWKGKALQKVDKHIRKSIGKEKTGGKKTPKTKTPKEKNDKKAQGEVICLACGSKLNENTFKERAKILKKLKAVK